VEGFSPSASSYAGNSNRAAKALKEAGTPVPARTLSAWKKREAQRYERIRQELQDRVFSQTAEEWLSLTRDAIEATGDAVAKAKQATAAGESREAKSWSGVARDLAVTGGVSDDKSTRGAMRPTSIREERSLQEIMGVIHRKFPNVMRVNPEFIEATAEEDDE
jgi:hypothetical protein